MPRKLTKKYLEWRSKVLKRDNYFCQTCHKQYGELEAHHIESWNSAPKLRYVQYNGVTLCITCHFYFHQIYGYGNNSLAQFERFTELMLKRIKKPKKPIRK